MCVREFVVFVLIFYCRHNVVPIVMGARPEDYADLLPPHSYIHVDDFRSPRDLATYLLKLDANDTLYNEYFRWKRDWQVTQDKWITMWCRLCGLLHAVIDGRSPYVHWYRDYASWWIGACDAQWVKRNSYHESWQTWKNETA
jgi:hypothetical protein